jgi:acetylornithine deacetylase
MVRAGEALGRGPVPVHAMSAATDGRHLTNHGGVPSINFGPGEMRRGHSPSESLPLADLRAAAEWIALFLVDTCGVAGRSA